jgi:protein-S-isoprenylcysteine O-methyltransferase Ste14
LNASLFSRGFTILRGVVYAVLFVWLWVWIAGAVRSFDARIPVTLAAGLRPLGFALAGLGAILIGASVATFVTRGRGTPAPFDPPREFVASGPYRYVRNPMYVGAAAAMLGAGLVLSSPSIVMLSAAFVLMLHLFLVLYEEPALARKFGAPYERYRSSVRRWMTGKPRSGEFGAKPGDQ